jgi:hypothetical protein
VLSTGRTLSGNTRAQEDAGLLPSTFPQPSESSTRRSALTRFWAISTLPPIPSSHSTAAASGTFHSGTAPDWLMVPTSDQASPSPHSEPSTSRSGTPVSEFPESCGSSPKNKDPSPSARDTWCGLNELRLPGERTLSTVLVVCSEVDAKRVEPFRDPNDGDNVGDKGAANDCRLGDSGAELRAGKEGTIVPTTPAEPSGSRESEYSMTHRSVTPASKLIQVTN